MCGFCGVPRLGLHWSAPLSGFDSQRARLERIKFLGHILKHARLKVSDFSGVGYQVKGATGKSAIAYDMNQLWDSIDILGGNGLDPLDAALMELMESYD